MKCHVYRSSVRDGLYVYVAVTDGESAVPSTTEPEPSPSGLAALPAPVRRQLGRAELAMTLELDRSRKLGQGNVEEVLSNLAKQGFHVQMPRDIEPEVRRIARETSDTTPGPSAVDGSSTIGARDGTPTNGGPGLERPVKRDRPDGD